MIKRIFTPISCNRWMPNLDNAVKGGRKLGVEPVMEARDMAR